jgi:hypothetical protein
VKHENLANSLAHFGQIHRLFSLPHRGASDLSSNWIMFFESAILAIPISYTYYTFVHSLHEMRCATDVKSNLCFYPGRVKVCCRALEISSSQLLGNIFGVSVACFGIIGAIAYFLVEYKRCPICQPLWQEWHSETLSIVHRSRCCFKDPPMRDRILSNLRALDAYFGVLPPTLPINFKRLKGSVDETIQFLPKELQKRLEICELYLMQEIDEQQLQRNREEMVFLHSELETQRALLPHTRYLDVIRETISRLEGKITDLESSQSLPSSARVNLLEAKDAISAMIRGEMRW